MTKHCYGCHRETEHDKDGICLVCFPTVRKLELLRREHPEVADGDYANELEDEPKPGNCRG